MPRRDGTGPLGQGAMTGRRMGNCAPNTAQELNNSEQPNTAQETDSNEQSQVGMGMAWGRGGGIGRGLAQRRGRGGSSRGQNNRQG